MATSMISLAPSYFFYFVMGSLICVYSPNILADDTVSVYAVNAQKNFKLATMIGRITFDGILHVRSSTVENNTLIAKLAYLNITYNSENNPDVDVYECKSSVGLKEAFLKPFALVYDADGRLHKIKVSEREPLVVSNLKFLFSGLLQIDVTKIERNEPRITVDSNEPLIYGSCDVKYDIKNPIGDSYVVDKNFNMPTCSLVNDTFNDSYLTEVCSSEENKNLKFSTVQNMNLTYTDSVDYSRSYTMEHITYKPFKNDENCSLFGVFLTLVQLLPKVEVDTISEYNLNVEVSAPTFTKVNKDIFQDKFSKNQRELKDLYQALACDAYNTNPYMDIFERVILC